LPSLCRSLLANQIVSFTPFSPFAPAPHSPPSCHPSATPLFSLHQVPILPLCEALIPVLPAPESTQYLWGASIQGKIRALRAPYTCAAHRFCLTTFPVACCCCFWLQFVSPSSSRSPIPPQKPVPYRRSRFLSTSRLIFPRASPQTQPLQSNQNLSASIHHQNTRSQHVQAIHWVRK